MPKELTVLCFEKWNRLLKFLLKRAAQFSLVDWIVLKGCLVSFGLMIGGLFAKLFKKLAPLMALIFFISWAYLVWRIFFDEETE